ncbi:MAG: Bro-N domain-containing protein [Thauera sp.]|nr:Bro-N domain-containing protein [Thauera sp.]
MTTITQGATAPTIFNFRSTAVRTIVIDDVVWFVASDVAKALGYPQAKDMARLLDEDERGRQIVPTPSGEQEVVIINESGLYHAVLRSRKPEARPFRKWVTAEVLPAIRKTGQYTAAPYTAGPHDTLTAEQAETLRDLIRLAADKLPKEKQGEFIQRGWSKLMSHFKVSYRKIPRYEFTEAVSIVARHCVQHGELLEAEQKPATTEQHILDAARAELTRPGRRFLTVFSEQPGQPVQAEPTIAMISIPGDAMVASWGQLPQLLREPGNGPTTAEASEIAKACVSVLARRMPA